MNIKTVKQYCKDPGFLLLIAVETGLLLLTISFFAGNNSV